ncbi:MAG: hypothetical protein A3J38_07015 [Gammaproteobacteria bacterium RIFCSPHIGHO2_12_FULL_45_9]|nr:MAG: hypothetical protein A3J38_07015 [Gammaproteobacteria bacterium RIFCSPHIGHO2_12_FULL_45_9]
MKEKLQITHILTMGDSLSDRGIMDERYLFGFIPMRRLSGLAKFSPQGRFTNGYTWDDRLSTAFANQFIIDDLKQKKHLTADDIADSIITHDRHIYSAFSQSYHLRDADMVQFRNLRFIRNYNEGGLSAHDYSWSPSYSLSRFVSRIILPSLADKFTQIVKDDNQFHISQDEKSSTLVLEWSGANDLITVNAKASFREVERAIQARVLNVNKLIAQGYRHFILFNLPDLSLTPRYQHGTEKARDITHRCCLYFNQLLDQACQQLKMQNANCTIRVFDINSSFTDMFNHPLKYHLEPEKIRQPYTTSPDFVLNANGTSPASGYIFWDDVHPTADIHAILADKFYDTFDSLYSFKMPKEKNEVELCMEFRKECQRLQQATQNKLFHRPSTVHHLLDFSKRTVLADILYLGLEKKDAYIANVMKNLGWVNQRGHVNPHITALYQAQKMLSNRQEPSFANRNHDIN